MEQKCRTKVIKRRRDKMYPHEIETKTEISDTFVLWKILQRTRRAQEVKQIAEKRGRKLIHQHS